MYSLLRHCFLVSVSKSRGIFLTCNSPGTGGVYWRLLACTIAFCNDKAVRFRPFLGQLFHVPAFCLFLNFILFFALHFHFYSWVVPFLSFRYCHCRNFFLFRFSFRTPASFLRFFFCRVEPSGNAPQTFCHPAAHLPETYLAEFAPEQELVHEQISEQQPEQNYSGFIVT